MKVALTRNFLETLCRYRHCASKDETRLHLNGVCLRNTEKADEVSLTSTDGVKLVKSQHDINFTLEHEYIFDSDILKDFERILKKKEHKDKMAFKAEFDDRGLTVYVCQEYDFVLRKLNREYYRENMINNIFPNKFEACNEVAFNIEHIKDIEKSLYPARSKKPKRLQFKLAGNKGPSLAYFEDDNKVKHDVLFMPMKLQ